LSLRERPLAAAVLVLGLAVSSTLTSAQNGTVRVTATRANVRSEASEKSPVLTQLPAGTIVPLVTVEGDWFRVQVPVSGLRVEAYLSRKVAALVTTPASATPPTRAGGPGVSVEKHPEVKDGMSVAVQVAGASSWLTPRPTRVFRLAETRDSIATLAALMPAAEPMLPTTGSTRVMYVWLLDGRSATRVIDDRRPIFAVLFKDIPGVSPDDVAPVVVRVAPTAWGARVIGAARGRADVPSRTEADWDVTRELRQDIVRVEAQQTERGTIKLQPVDALSPGDYAVVLRPNGRKRLAGSVVLAPEGEGRLFGIAFEFAIK
jgi:hypothetical protein